MTSHPNSFAARTHCINGHDLSLPNAVAKQSNGHSRCRECRNRIARESRQASFANCKQCRAPKSTTSWEFCCNGCARVWRANRKAEQNRSQDAQRQADDNRRAERILNLQIERERAATHWERDAITQRIQQLGMGRPSHRVTCSSGSK